MSNSGQSGRCQRSETGAKIAHALNDALKHARKSRSEIADALSERLTWRVSVHILNNWASDSKAAFRLPAEVIPPLNEILGHNLLLRALMNQRELITFGLGERDLKRLDNALRARERRKRV